jgi:enolase
MKITAIKGRQIIDSRGNPTVEVDVVLENGAMGRAAAPSGASTGSHEAIELRDNDKKRYGGKGVMKAVGHINEELAKAVRGMNAENQRGIDAALIAADGTPNKAKLGANAILAISLAVAKAAATAKKIPLFRHIGTMEGITDPRLMPSPMMNIINGGKHAAGSTDIQEFMIIPTSARSFSEALRIGTEIFHALGKLLNEKGYGTTVGDEGGYAPAVKNGNEEALALIEEATLRAGYTMGGDINLALDVASSELRNNGKYRLATENKILSSGEMAAWYKSLAERHHIVSIEDGLAEDDWAGWRAMAAELPIQLVGDDLLVTNTEFIKKAIEEKAANAVLVKPNQIGTLTETIEAVRMAKAAGWRTILSHRSGETEDTTIAHIAVGLGVGQIKTGSLCRTDRVAKYNELLRIEEELGARAHYPSALFA